MNDKTDLTDELQQKLLKQITSILVRQTRLGRVVVKKKKTQKTYWKFRIIL